jgi:hypothetical protein
VKTITKIALTLAILFASVEFVRSNILYYLRNDFDLDLAGRIGNSGSILMLAIAGLAYVITKESNNE